MNNNQDMDTPRLPDEDAIAVFDAVKKDIFEKLKELRHDDLIAKEASYGWNYFGKIEVAPGKYVHARAHKYHQHNQPIDFYNLDTGGLGNTHDLKVGCIRTLEDPLVMLELNLSKNKAKKVHKKKRKRKHSSITKLSEKDQVERDLEALVFGVDHETLRHEVFERVGCEHVLEEHKDTHPKIIKDKTEENEDESNKPLFVIDIQGNRPQIQKSNDPVSNITSSDSSENSDQESEEEETLQKIDREDSEDNELLKLGKRAWDDPDDKSAYVSLNRQARLKKLKKTEEEDVISGDKYEIRLRQQHEKLHPTPSWATLPTNLLPPEEIKVIRVKDANRQAYSQCAVQSVSFHPNAQMLMTAGFDMNLRLFQIDGKINQKIQSVYIKDMPIFHAEFNSTGTEIIASGRRPFFYVYDIEAGHIEKSNRIHGRQQDKYEHFRVSPCGRYIVFVGRDGFLNLISYQTKQWIANMKINSWVNGVDWSGDGKYLYSVGSDAMVHQWDVGTRRCVHRFKDHGGFKPTSIAVSKDDEYLSIGSRSGIVNVYDKSCLTSNNPSPLKAISNLTTAIHHTKFNHDSQILGITSNSKKGQLKMVHLPSLTVFKNWPASTTPLGYVESFDFSPNSGYMAIGNAKGKVLLYRLRHFASA
ncbi:10724_t:CDS:10 [Ambispora gerdemannii]|uniref:U3 small nucleolar RNA-associated protein 18 homolog n=1 Tax=Ambispora gerdemannii TaxID=144530 RepID=A0A9N8V457_9GLOM|nr:10724_t:CDS:10 [Ambispora gerdemannii]